MHSRVAAVKAPRTHNRRRVTGSSGRREGRESERQRPNMSRRVFTSAVLLPLLIVMMCCGSGTVAADEQSTASKFEWRGVAEVKETVDSLGVPGLVKVGSDVFAVAEAQCKKKDTEVSSSFTGIASQLLTAATAAQPMELLTDPKAKTQVLVEGTSNAVTQVDVSRPTTVVGENNIYMLVGKYSSVNPASCQGEAGTAPWGLLLVKGRVSSTEEPKNIHWYDTHAIPCAFLSQQQESLERLIGSGGSGVHTEDNTLVFPVEATKKEKDEKAVSMILYLKDTNKWKLSKGMSDDGCSNPSIVEWGKDKKLIMMTACDGGRRRVYESDDMGDSWTEALGTLSRVWGNKQGESVKLVRSGFTTAKYEHRDVMLVTLPVYAKEIGNKKDKLHLWLTDNTHIVDIGPVSREEDDAAASSLLYKHVGDNEELIALYEKKGDGETTSSGVVPLRLTKELKRVKDVLATWKEVDKRVSKLCPPSSATEDASPENACSTDFDVTAGLVGFLSGNFSGMTWVDEYLGVNATVKGGATGATNTSDGVTFQGAWAEWPVGSQGENQLYHFANYNFTLVATVSIDGVPEGDNTIPVIGVKMNDAEKTVFFGLSYNNKEKKWMLLCGDRTSKEHSSPLTPGKTHQAAIVLRNGTQSTVYVDGKRVGGDAQCEVKVTDSEGISHFYIGGDGSGAENERSRGVVPVTVKDVLLYNRPLTFSGWKADVDEVIASPPGDTLSPAVSGLDARGAVSQSTSGRPQRMEQGALKGGDVADGGVVSSAASTATTPSSDVAQTVATGSGDTMQGSGSPQTPEVSANSGGYGETAGGTDAQGEGIRPQDGELNATALRSNLGNFSQGNNIDAATMCESRLSSLLLLLLGLWGFAAL
ncbi:trans-sialidase, putative [Trypanosoma cruzi marinkellei]|uniref:Trans-sialidase, putative n=2 Tax=Trypanosoma cruzi marinkellei TaxID=85056 RepID=K2N7Q8_TRYCR|nr:trans-sialidase, putative [Trypanosoma cruzi marinkellei]